MKGSRSLGRASALSLVDSYKKAFRRSDAEALLRLVHPDCPRDRQDYFRSLIGAKTRYLVRKVSLRPYERPTTDYFKTHDPVPEPLWAVELHMVGHELPELGSRPERREPLYLGPLPDNDGLCISHFVTKGRARAEAVEEFDEAALRERIRIAAAAAFRQAKKEAGKDLYAFALYTDDDAMTVLPAANTERALAARAEGYGFTTEQEIDRELRWSVGEWGLEGVGRTHFSDICSHLAVFATGTRTVKGGKRRFRKGVHEAAIGALEELEAKGAFGAGVSRERLTVFVSISDSDEATRLELASVRRLNPKRARERFMRGR